MTGMGPQLRQAWGLFSRAMRAPFMVVEIGYDLRHRQAASSPVKREIAVRRPRDGSGRFLPRTPPVEVVTE